MVVGLYLEKNQDSRISWVSYFCSKVRTGGTSNGGKVLAAVKRVKLKKIDYDHDFDKFEPAIPKEFL